MGLKSLLKGVIRSSARSRSQRGSYNVGWRSKTRSTEKGSSRVRSGRVRKIGYNKYLIRYSKWRAKK